MAGESSDCVPHRKRPPEVVFAVALALCHPYVCLEKCSTLRKKEKRVIVVEGAEQRTAEKRKECESKMRPHHIHNHQLNTWFHRLS